MRRIFVFAFIQLIFLSACGGGDGLLGSNDSSGNGSGGSQSIAPAASNVASITVDAGPSGVGSAQFNIPYVSVTVCPHGSTVNCQTIYHIEVDTGSYGLRVISSVMSSALLQNLSQEATSANVPIVECTQFGDGFSWGSMRIADVSISGETASGVPMQVIGDPNYPNIPTDCSNTGAEEDTVPTFGANGIIGVGPFVQDCGDCTFSTEGNVYYACSAGSASACSPAEVLQSQEAANPVASFQTDNNGVIVELPPVGSTGLLSVTGSLVFGIDTQANNKLGSATVLTTDTSEGFISITYKNVPYPDSFIDSGSNLIYLTDGSIAQCTDPNESGFLCPGSTQNLSALNQGVNGTQSTVSFTIANAETLFNTNPSFTAFSNMGGVSSESNSFDFGLPFFFGRNVYTAIAGGTTTGGPGPYFAY